MGECVEENSVRTATDCAIFLSYLKAHPSLFLGSSESGSKMSYTTPTPLVIMSHPFLKMSTKCEN